MNEYHQTSERAVLCTLMNAPSTFATLRPNLPEDLFLNATNRTVYGVMCSMQDRGEHIDLLSICATLDKMGIMQAVGGPGAITELDVIHAVHAHSLASEAPNFVDFYVKQMREAWARQKRAAAAEEFLEGAITAEGFQEVMAATDPVRDERSMGIRAALMEMVEEIENRGDGGQAGLPSGFSTLDEFTGGWCDGDLIVLGAETGGGKTAFALSTTRHLSVENGNAVGIFSMEMSKKELATRLISSVSQIPLMALRHGRLSAPDLSKMADATKRVSNSPIYINDDSDLTTTKMRAVARQWKIDHGIRMIVVDYLQLLACDADSREQAVAACARSCKAMARELDIPVMILSQLNEHGMLRESRAIGHESDLVLLAHQAKEEIRDKGRLIQEESAPMIQIKKQRNGPRHNGIEMKWNAQCAEWEPT